jgi:hypothetical protein
MLLQRDLDRTVHNEAFKPIECKVPKCHRCVKSPVKLCPKAVNRNSSACAVDFQVCAHCTRIIHFIMLLPTYLYIASGTDQSRLALVVR